VQSFTAGEQLLGGFNALFSHLSSLSPGEVALDVALSVAIVAAAFGLDHLARRLLRVGARRTPGRSTAEKKVRASRAIRVSGSAIGFGLTLAALYLLARVWGVDPAFWARGLAGSVLKGALGLVVLFAIVACTIELVGFLIDRMMGGLAVHSKAGRRAAQLRTLSPILKAIAQTAIVITAGLMVLSQMGVKIGPLLAGAGVVGVAIGFGAQTLVKDFLTGLFLIIEDIVSVDDVVQIGGFGGLVEQMTVRTIRLRDFDGTLHIFPYSEAQVIHNMTKTFSYYVFDLVVSFESDIDRAVGIMRETGEVLAAEPAFKSKILEPIEVVGVDGFADSGVKLKARIKTRPIEQWTVGREYNRRIKLAFDKAGITIPYPHTRLVLPDQMMAAMNGGAVPAEAAQ
jgi:small conductance mechanosensitive channel